MSLIRHQWEEGVTPERALTLMTLFWTGIFLHIHKKQEEMCELRTDLMCRVLFYFIFSVVQESTCTVGDEEEAGGGSFTVHPERRDTDCGSGSGQTSLGEGLQSGETRWMCHQMSLSGILLYYLFYHVASCLTNWKIEKKTYTKQLSVTGDQYKKTHTDIVVVWYSESQV